MTTKSERIKAIEEHLAIKARERVREADPTKRICIDTAVKDYIGFASQTPREIRYFNECYQVFQICAKR